MNLNPIYRDPIYFPIRMGDKIVTDEKTGRKRVEADYIDYELMYCMEAFMKLEKDYGSVDAAMETLTSDKVENIAILVHCGFLHLENPPTLSQVARSIDTRDLGRTAELIKTVMTADVEATGIDPNK